MPTMETASQTDFLKEHADNIWFVLGAYFFAFFPWGIINNIDFISEKWRPCRRTRRLAYTHLALSVFPIIYVAVYAEAQRRDEDNKEYGAALAALMFNVLQLMRTVMGLLQLNAFEAWCKHADECIAALCGARSKTRDDTRTMMEIMRQWQKVFLSKCKRGSRRMRRLLQRDGEGIAEGRNGDVENTEDSVKVDLNTDGNEVHCAKEYLGSSQGTTGGNDYVGADVDSKAEVSEDAVKCTAENCERGTEYNAWSSEEMSKQETITALEISLHNPVVSCFKRVSKCVSRKLVNDGNEIEKIVMVNNMVVDNELGGAEVTVLPSLEKIWSGLKNGAFTPSKWLWTDRVILNTVRWGGAYLCGMGKEWGVSTLGYLPDRECHHILETFFSEEMKNMRNILQDVEWNMKVKNQGSEFFRIGQSDDDQAVPLTGEMTTAYGNCGARYNLGGTSTVDAYSFEFENLVSSHPATDKKLKKYVNRERIVVGLVHSVLLAKHLGVEKLKAIWRYYDGHRLEDKAVHHKALKLLLKQTNMDISDDAKIWTMFESIYHIPIFPYRMQMVSLWDEATNWRVLQASAHQDIHSSRCCVDTMQSEDKTWILRDAPRPVNIFDYCAKWIIHELDRTPRLPQGSLGVVLETVRTFLADWITSSSREPDWEPAIPTAFVEFNTGQIAEGNEDWDIIWICQRELQRKIAKMSRDKGNLSGDKALIMIFILGFPLLCVKDEEDADSGARFSQDSRHESSASVSPNNHHCVDLNVQVWRAWTPLAPQLISVIIRNDPGRNTVSLRLENDSGQERFLWQDWVDAAMGCMAGFEKGRGGKGGYGRKIVKAELRKPMVELCPLRVSDDGREAFVERTDTTRIWTGWPPFDTRICKFEVDQWLKACKIDLKNRKRDEVVQSVEGVMRKIVSAENEQVEVST